MTQKQRETLTLSGVVFIPSEAATTDSVYRSGIRPNAKTEGGLVASELTLLDEAGVVSAEPIPATLRFFYPVASAPDTSEIELFAGSNLLMRFKVDA